MANSKVSDKPSNQGGILEFVKILAQALILAFVVRTFLFQPFSIPSGSMMNTLLVGDFLFVSKFSYGFSQYSIQPSIIPFSGRIWGAQPERGDVVVFKKPTDNETDYIKRCIGLPGDTIQMIDGVLHINGVAVKRERIADFVDVDEFGMKRSMPRYRETLPNGVSYDTLDLSPNSEMDNTQVYTVPPDHYFMMGDNRDNSQDSRYLNAVGYVPYENLVGKAQVIFFSIDDDTPVWKVWEWPTEVRWSRIFTLL